mmetsp:Transcript_98261/g.305596  ORF Transcript_98261/g.305596 Transcript_98261/m.305596 type:complete len:331 (-) Transcript_98261:284-1276(-)
MRCGHEGRRPRRLPQGPRARTGHMGGALGRGRGPQQPTGRRAGRAWRRAAGGRGCRTGRSGTARACPMGLRRAASGSTAPGSPRAEARRAARRPARASRPAWPGPCLGKGKLRRDPRARLALGARTGASAGTRVHSRCPHPLAQHAGSPKRTSRGPHSPREPHPCKQTCHDPAVRQSSRGTASARQGPALHGNRPKSPCALGGMMCPISRRRGATELCAHRHESLFHQLQRLLPLASSRQVASWQRHQEQQTNSPGPRHQGVGAGRHTTKVRTFQRCPDAQPPLRLPSCSRLARLLPVPLLSDRMSWWPALVVPAGQQRASRYAGPLPVP